MTQFLMEPIQVVFCNFRKDFLQIFPLVMMISFPMLSILIAIIWSGYLFFSSSSSNRLTVFRNGGAGGCDEMQKTNKTRSTAKREDLEIENKKKHFSN
ncbi:hypothetical protein DERF_004636 [Dermatophagoides farinae]|uniref:Uncharacterized protein n=1 Tax=Dermatophagoides farinae TaxID=6954 RepID=A0A922L5E7_DERFA|nr:hypothetical protein DERF_004636 [Dermatophagoides farinae]